MSRLLEVCCDSLDAARAAEAGGARRIELCACLECDGLTPSAGLLSMVLARIRLPVFAMVRPRPGDFVYSPGEREVMLADIAEAKARGAAGIVSGALGAGGAGIDRETTAALVAAAQPLPFTFHRAFDRVSDPERALAELADLGVARVLTSGGCGRAAEGTASLLRYQGLVAGRIRIVACGGIRAATIAGVAAIGVLREFHSAARTSACPQTVDKEEVAAMARILSE